MSYNTWSKIQYTELFGEAFIKITDNHKCEYHNHNHVDSMYEYLQTANVPYDANLDWAVVFHDLVYDELPRKEQRSAMAFYDMANRYRGFQGTEVDKIEVGILIGLTVTHEVHSFLTPTQKAIIHADLHELTDPVKTTRNFVKIMDESMALYGVSQKEFAKANVEFLTGLRERMFKNISVDKDNESFYKEVIDGIDLTIRLAKALGD